jgi:hypothetical protein
MLVKKYAIYKIEKSEFDAFSNMTVNSYSSNEYNIRFNKQSTQFSKFNHIPKNSLLMKDVDDTANSIYFDNEYDAIKAVELNRLTLNFDKYDCNISILPVLVEVTDIQEIRRLKIKGILQDDGQ